jgi:hypothetical protein
LTSGQLLTFSCPQFSKVFLVPFFPVKFYLPAPVFQISIFRDPTLSLSHAPFSSVLSAAHLEAFATLVTVSFAKPRFSPRFQTLTLQSFTLEFLRDRKPNPYLCTTVPQLALKMMMVLYLRRPKELTVLALLSFQNLSVARALKVQVLVAAC